MFRPCHSRTIGYNVCFNSTRIQWWGLGPDPEIVAKVWLTDLFIYGQHRDRVQSACSVGLHFHEKNSWIRAYNCPTLFDVTHCSLYQRHFWNKVMPRHCGTHLTYIQHRRKRKDEQGKSHVKCVLEISNRVQPRNILMKFRARAPSNSNQPPHLP